MSFFTALIAKPATGKSGGLKLVRRELRLLEECRKVMPKESRLLNPATVEAMIHYLELYGTIICMWDESNQFLGSFGRYNAQGANYERSIYLECANAGDDFTLNLTIDDAILTLIIRKLYPPESPYEFSVIPVVKCCNPLNKSLFLWDSISGSLL